MTCILHFAFSGSKELKSVVEFPAFSLRPKAASGVATAVTDGGGTHFADTKIAILIRQAARSPARGSQWHPG